MVQSGAGQKREGRQGNHGPGGPKWQHQDRPELQGQGVCPQPLRGERGRLADLLQAARQRRRGLSLRRHVRSGGHAGHRLSGC